MRQNDITMSSKTKRKRKKKENEDKKDCGYGRFKM